MADKKNLCAMIPADLHARVRQEQDRSGRRTEPPVRAAHPQTYAFGVRKIARLSGRLDRHPRRVGFSQIPGIG